MSDQDFFFDEDEQPTAAAPAKKDASPARASQPAAVSAPQSVSMAVASLIGVIALLAGVIVGILLPIGASPSPTAATGTVAPTGSSTAPQLTEEQLQGGELPAGHPDIGAMSGGATGTAGSQETTTKK